MRHLAPLAGFAVVFGLYRLFYDLARIDDKLALGGALTGLDGVGLEMAIDGLLARITWALSGVLFMLAWLVGAAALVYITATALRRASSLCRLASGALLAVAVVGLATWRNPLTLPRLEPILLETFDQMNLASGERLLYLVNGLALLAAVLIVLASTALLVGSDREAEDAGRLRARLRSLRLALYLGAAILVAGVLHAVAVHQLPLPLLEQDAASVLDRAGKSVSAAMGLLWTLLLLGIYAPAALILRQDALRLAQAATATDSESSRSEWLSKNHLAVPLWQQLTSLLAILAPLLAGGPGATLIEILVGR